MKMKLAAFSVVLVLIACSPSKQIAKSAKQIVINDSALLNAHFGISIYEPATGKYLYNYQGDKYFVPASNTKIPTCYAAMKYLGDSLVGLRYGYSSDKEVLAFQPTGDPTLLHPDFKNQPVWDFFSEKSKKYKDQIGIMDTIWREKKWGSGWGWSDFQEDYMAERSVMPVYGNVINIRLNPIKDRRLKDTTFYVVNVVSLFKTQHRFFDSMVNRNTYLASKEAVVSESPLINLSRGLDDNNFRVYESRSRFANTSIPFSTGGNRISLELLSSEFGYSVGLITPRYDDTVYSYFCPDCRTRAIVIKQWNTIHSQPTDSLLKPMMHRSDNFFAEQSLLMVSNERLGMMNDAKIIDTILKTDFKDLPQKPTWADGSGLSRYNLFTPQDMVFILNKMQSEFGMERIKEIFATGGEGTLSNYYKSIHGFIFAKTGTLSGVVALSGFLYTKKNKMLIFSVLVNNHHSSATEVRRAVEKFVIDLRNKN